MVRRYSIDMISSGDSWGTFKSENDETARAKADKTITENLLDKEPWYDGYILLEIKSVDEFGIRTVREVF